MARESYIVWCFECGETENKELLVGEYEHEDAAYAMADWHAQTYHGKRYGA